MGVSSVECISDEIGLHSSLKLRIQIIKTNITKRKSYKHTLNQVVYSLNLTNQSYVDRDINVFLNYVQYVLHHSVDLIIANKRNHLHVVVLNILLMNQQFFDRVH